MTETAAQYFTTIANCVVNLPLAFVAVTGNAFVLYGVWKTPSLRSPSNLLLCGLASTDLIVGLIAQPLFITEVLVGLYSRSENLTFAFTKAHQMIARSLCGVSLLMIAGISIDKFIGTVKPLCYPSTVTAIRVTRFVVASWALSVLASSTEFWSPRVTYAISSFHILTCLSSSITCHAAMYKIMLRHRLQIHTNFQAINDSNTRTAMPRLRRSTFNTFVVFIVLMICYFPYLAAYMV
ncbi:trace amine-associated receptor 7g-like [Acropora millepora]|uniref:trace amine-associated receptor 7g-like n=1 Tax=Acropora millepora TaxID=45264 RepID=UPI001CF3340C|nr:trace amine-associated receptor 7g-like [Acropora millepora]